MISTKSRGEREGGGPWGWAALRPRSHAARRERRRCGSQRSDRPEARLPLNGQPSPMHRLAVGVGFQLRWAAASCRVRSAG